MAFEALAYTAETWAPDAGLLQREETFTAIASCSTYFVVGTTHSNLFVFSTNGDYLVSLDVNEHVSREVTAVGPILYLACSTTCCVAFGTATGLVWCWDWRQDRLECWSSREGRVVDLCMCDAFTMDTGALCVAQKPSAVLRLRGASAPAAERRKLLLSPGLRDANTAAPPLRHLCYEQGMLLVSMHHQVFCCDATTGAILASFREQKQPPPPARQSSPGARRGQHQDGAQQRQSQSQIALEDEDEEEKREGKGAEKGEEEDEHSQASQAQSRLQQHQQQHQQQRPRKSQLELRNKPGIEKQLLTPLLGSRAPSPDEASAAVRRIVCAGEHIYVQYSQRVYVFSRDNFATAPFRLERVVACPHNTHLFASTGQHMFFFTTGVALDANSGCHATDPKASPQRCPKRGRPGAQAVRVASMRAEDDEKADGREQSCVVAGQDGRQRQRVPLHHGSFGPAIAVTSFFVVQNLEAEGFNAFGNTHVLALFPRSAAVIRVATHAEQVLALCARYHFALAQHQCQQRVSQPGVLVQVSNAYANRLWQNGRREEAMRVWGEQVLPVAPASFWNQFASRLHTAGALHLLVKWLPFNDRSKVRPAIYLQLLMDPLQHRQYALLLSRVARWPVLYPAPQLRAALLQQLRHVERFPALSFTHTAHALAAQAEEHVAKKEKGEVVQIPCLAHGTKAEDVVPLLATLFKLSEFANHRQDMWQALFWIKAVLSSHALDVEAACHGEVDDAESGMALRRCLQQVQTTRLWTLMRESGIALPRRTDRGDGTGAKSDPGRGHVAAAYGELLLERGEQTPPSPVPRGGEDYARTGVRDLHSSGGGTCGAAKNGSGPTSSTPRKHVVQTQGVSAEMEATRTAAAHGHTLLFPLTSGSHPEQDEDEESDGDDEEEARVKGEGQSEALQESLEVLRLLQSRRPEL